MTAGVVTQQGYEFNGIIGAFLAKLDIVPFEQSIKPLDSLFYKFPYQSPAILYIGGILIVSLHRFSRAPFLRN